MFDNAASRSTLGSTESSWNYADVWHRIATLYPERSALRQADRNVTWRSFDRSAHHVGAALLNAGLNRQAKVAQYLHNCPEYLEAVYASFLASLVPVNTNYRYKADELAYLWTNADVEAVVFHGSFSEVIESIRSRVPCIRFWCWVDDGSGPCPRWAIDYSSLMDRSLSADVKMLSRVRRKPDDLLLLYTGGTTGMPKGVMWRQDDIFAVLNSMWEIRYPENGSAKCVPATLKSRVGPSRLFASALMHGTALLGALGVLATAGCVLLLEDHRFSAEAVLDAVTRLRPDQLSIVGDAFAKPLAAALDAYPGRWDISSLKIVTSAGAIWSTEGKEGLLRHNPKLLCVDALGSSEAMGLARGTTSGQRGGGFKPSPNAAVITEDGRRVKPGTGEIGMIAVSGRLPLGYYKDEEQTTQSFRVIDGERWSFPGDFGTIDAHGQINFIGRGSVCINTGGEKVFPDEVEMVLKDQPGIADAIVVGTPDERFGEIVIAVVETEPGATAISHELIRMVKNRLASYKAPKRVLVVESLERGDDGKVDYRRWQAKASVLLAMDPQKS